ncbi:MAG TPA: chitobiase/beta-hexosaminidase C-terminal domain-containing protein, partial [Fibrobacteria bacterium]|nr:chitobiase/beta-hexosaminidase C-terminal domain-containing protein [Fibrobacteria bacterium]
MKIGGAKVNPENATWKATVLLGAPGELTRIRVEAWDGAKNKRDTELVVARDQVPSTLPPTARWLNPSIRTGTLVPFVDSTYLVRVSLTDLSGIDSGSVLIHGRAARKVNDSVWEGWVDLPPNGVAQAITLEAKNKRGVPISDFAMLTRDRDTVKAVTLSDTNGKLRSGSFWVKLACSTPGSTIRYSLDGSDPTVGSPLFVDSIKIDTTMTLKARAFAKDRVDGPMVTQKYQLAVPVGVFGGESHVLILMSDASIWGMGTNNCEAIPDGKGCMLFGSRDILSPRKVADSVAQMSSGWNYSLWVKINGDLWGVGKDVNGTLASGSNADKLNPILITRGVEKVISAGSTTYILKTDRTLWGAGNNYNGQLGVGDFTSRNQLVKISDDVYQIGASERSLIYLRSDKTMWHTGLGLADESRDSLPRKILDSVDLVPEVFWESLLIRKSDGSLWGIGAN